MSYESLKPIYCWKEKIGGKDVVKCESHSVANKGRRLYVQVDNPLPASKHVYIDGSLLPQGKGYTDDENIHGNEGRSVIPDYNEQKYKTIYLDDNVVFVIDGKKESTKNSGCSPKKHLAKQKNDTCQSYRINSRQLPASHDNLRIRWRFVCIGSEPQP